MEYKKMWFELKEKLLLDFENSKDSYATKADSLISTLNNMAWIEVANIKGDNDGVRTR